MMCKKLFAIGLIMVFILSNLSYAKQLSKELADGGGSVSEFSADSRYARGGSGLVNLLTGTSRYQMSLMGIASKTGLSAGLNLFYCGAVEGQALKDNNVAPTGNVALGWYLGFSSIYSDPKSTVDMSDDEYFYRESDGSICAIMRQGTAHDNYTFTIKNHPYWKVIAFWTNTIKPDRSGLNYDISGWEITLPDGVKYKYGTSTDAIRYLPYDGYSTFDACGTYSFYYQWDLSSIKDKNDGKLNFKYDIQKECACSTFFAEDSVELGIWYEWSGWSATPSGSPDDPKPKSCSRCSNCYITTHYSWFIQSSWMYFAVCPAHSAVRTTVVKHSYLSSIASDNGDTMFFIFIPKTQGEFAASNLGEENQYLKSVSFKRHNDVKEKIVFTYSGDGGQVSHINAGTTMIKRLLTGINQTMGSGELNRVFEYCQKENSPALLKKILEPMIGKSSSFSYGVQYIDKNSKTYGVNVVKQTVLSSGVTVNPDIVTSYKYSSAVADQDIDLESGIGYFGNVTTRTGTGAGYTVTKFDLDKAKTTNLLGTCTSVENYTSSSKLVSSVSYEYLAKMFGPATPTTSQWYLPVLKTTATTMYGVTTKSGVSLNAVDVDENSGAASLSWATGNDGKTLVTKRTFAYKDNLAAMGPTGVNMLTPEASNKIYQVSSFDPATCDISSGTVVKASYNFWTNASGVWRPSATYVWKSDMNASGLPIATFHDFDAAHPTDNGWQCTGTIDKYDAVGAAIQVTDASNVSSAVIYGHSNHLPIASISNAGFDDCAVFTATYDLDDDKQYFDKANGWVKGAKYGVGPALEVNSAKKHFGQKSLYINNSQGPYKNVYICPNKDYVLSAWIYPVASAPIKFGANVYIDNSATSTYDRGQIISAFTLNQWQYIEIPVSLSTLTDIQPTGTTRNDFVKIWIGNTDAMTPTAFYIDDIRFYPKGALLTTTYYDETWNKPILVVDANNKPSTLTEYDSYGRPSKTYKIKADGTQTKTSLKEYHLMGQDLRVVTPNGGEILAPGQQFSIAWSGDATQGTNGVDITYSSDNGSTWSTVTNGSTNATQLKATNSFLCTVPATAATGCLIKVQAHDDATNTDQSDATFIVSDYLKVTSPAGGETWWGGKRNAPPWSTIKHTITWTTTGGTDANVRIDYFDGKAWRTIVSSTPNDGTYDWTQVVGYDPGGLTRIRISDALTGLRARESEKFNFYVNHGYVRRVD